jgi:hypothetical protein
MIGFGLRVAVLSAALTAAAAAADCHEGGARMLSGGIGEDSRQALLREEHRHSLKLVFTLNEGNYVAGVDVELSPVRGGTVLRHHADGPFALACLPPGRYTVTAEYDGRRQSRPVVIGKGLRTEYFRWPAASGDFALAPEHRAQ